MDRHKANCRNAENVRTRRGNNALWRAGVAAVDLLAAAALAAGVAASAARAAVPNPVVTGPITASCNPTCPSPPGPTDGIHVPKAFDGASNLQEFKDAGYTEEEYFFAGTATAYERDPTASSWDSSGFWTARPSTTIPSAFYRSRMLVRRPTDPKRFNGIVVMEWFNVTAQIDLPPDYGYFRTELLRDGFIWVGVSAQFVGVEGSPLLPGFALKSWDPVRYGSLTHPGDDYCYDIFSQAAQAILHPVGVNPLGSSDYVVTGMIADGESQSAGRMTTYVDAVQPLAGLFDAFLIHSRGAGGAGLFSGSGGSVPSPSFIRTDGPPVLVFETETDTVGHFPARQPDGSNYRLWEPAGTAHVDDYDSMSFSVNQATTEPFYPPQVCVFPSNMANERYVMNAAIWHLSRWIHGGTPPPSAPPITVVGGAIQRDQYNNALGGIRLPELDVPTQTLQGVGNTSSPPSPFSFCVLYGRTVPLGSECVGGAEPPGTLCLTDAQCLLGGTCQAVDLSSVYDNHGSYASKFIQATNDLVKAGFLLEPDAQEARTQAAQSDVP